MSSKKYPRWHLANPPFECHFTEVIPPNNLLMTFAIPPHVLIFQANLSGPPSESFQSFQQSALLSSQLRLIPPLYSPKNQVIPLKILRPLPQPINNDRSLSIYTEFFFMIDSASAGKKLLKSLVAVFSHLRGRRNSDVRGAKGGKSLFSLSTSSH